MDSYSYRDGPGRSPGDRTWSARDDRVKDEPRDSFYRGRSPGALRILILLFSIIYRFTALHFGLPSMEYDLQQL